MAKNKFSTNVRIIEAEIQKPRGKRNTKFLFSTRMFPGKREREGIFANKIIRIPMIIKKHPSKNKGASIFILKYIFQDEVVNGNVPPHYLQFFNHREHRERKAHPSPLIFIFLDETSTK